MNATNEPAHPFGARCIPRVIRVVEMMGIEQARKWGVGGLNELRRVLGLKAYETFLQWNPDPVIAGAAEALYGSIDNLELYPGLLAEETKKPIPRAGLCPGFTVSRAILSYAVALVRGDRLLSVERTAANMTAWGYQDTQRDTEKGAFGCMMSKLLLRTLPGAYSPSSVYPFVTPKAMRVGLEKHQKHLVQNYDWSTAAAAKRPDAEDPSTPTAASSVEVEVEVLAPPLVIQNGTGSGHAEPDGSINQQKPSAGDSHLTNLTFGPATRSVAALHSLLGEQAPSGWVDTDAMKAAVCWNPCALLHIHPGLQLSSYRTRCLLTSRKETYFTATDFRTLYECIHILPYAADQSGAFKMRTNAMSLGRTLIHQIKSELDKAASLASHLKFSEDYAKSSRETFLAKFHQQRTCASIEDLAAELFGSVIAVIPVWGVVMTTIINYYLDSSRSARLEEIVRLCNDDSRERSEVETALEVYCQIALGSESPLSNVAKTITLSHKGKQSGTIDWPPGLRPGDTVISKL